MSAVSVPQAALENALDADMPVPELQRVLMRQAALPLLEVFDFEHPEHLMEVKKAALDAALSAVAQETVQNPGPLKPPLPKEVFKDMGADEVAELNSWHAEYLKLLQMLGAPRNGASAPDADRISATQVKTIARAPHCRRGHSPLCALHAPVLFTAASAHCTLPCSSMYANMDKFILKNEYHKELVITRRGLNAVVKSHAMSHADQERICHLRIQTASACQIHF